MKRPTLHFGKPRVSAAPVAHLKWGAGLLSFQPEANLAGQVSKVEVYGWDVKRKETIVGRASADDVAGPQGKSIAQHRQRLWCMRRARSRRCACASRCSPRPKPTSARRPRSAR